NQLAPDATGDTNDAIGVEVDQSHFCADSNGFGQQHYALQSGQQAFCVTLPGTLSVAEAAPPAGRPFVRLSCDDAQSPTPSTVDQSTRSASINVDPGETVRCVWLNTTQAGTVIFENQLAPDASGATSDTIGLNVDPHQSCAVNGFL